MRTCSSFNLPVVSPFNLSNSNPKRCNSRRSKQPFILKESHIDTMADQRTMAELLRARTEGYAKAIVRHNHRRSKQHFILEESPIDTMADQCTMAELLRAPTEGYAEAIVVPPILAEQFKLKHSLINMMTSDQFFGLEKENSHDHIRCFNKITSTIKYKDVPNSQIKLMLFPFSLAGTARWRLEKEPQQISVMKSQIFNNGLMNHFMRHVICPHHGFTELQQLDTFYNALNPADQDSLNSAAGGNLLEIRTQDCLAADGNTFPELRDNIQGYVAAAAVNYNQGARINLMPLYVWKKLCLPELIFTRMTLELANRAICIPAGIARDVFVLVDKFTFTANFVIVDYESDLRFPLILGRPFLRTARALIDVHEYDDDLQFDIESNFKEIEYLLHHNPIKDIDSSFKDSIDQSNIANLADSMPEMFTDKHALNYSSPPIFDEYDDDLFKVESDTENVYDDPLNSKERKSKSLNS
nr:reverse transcriptase domain-containing protein [Tanacetum cinerariifolium]